MILSQLHLLAQPSKVGNSVRPERSHGGDEEDRTPDPLRARQVLSQLSYVPMKYAPKSDVMLRGLFRLFRGPRAKILLVGLSGLEPPTSPLSGVRSNQLS